MQTIIKSINNPVLLAWMLGFGFVVDLVLMGRAYALDTSEWAAWVQAVGSIAAIVGAGWLGHRDARERRNQAMSVAIATGSNMYYAIAIMQAEVATVIKMMKDDKDPFNIGTLAWISETLSEAPRWSADEIAAITPLGHSCAIGLAESRGNMDVIARYAKDFVAVNLHVSDTSRTEVGGFIIERLDRIERRLDAVTTSILKSLNGKLPRLD